MGQLLVSRNFRYWETYQRIADSPEQQNREGIKAAAYFPLCYVNGHKIDIVFTIYTNIPVSCQNNMCCDHDVLALRRDAFRGYHYHWSEGLHDTVVELAK